VKPDERYEQFTDEFARRLAATKPPPRRGPGASALGAVAVLLVAAVVVVGTTRSANHAATGPVRAGQPSAIENEATAPPPDAPDEYLDLKQSSAQDVSVAQVKQAQAQAAAVPVAGGTPWQLEGPSNIGGRVVDLVVDNQQPDSIYVAASGGGIWKSTDQGMTYASVWPDSVVQNMGALAQASDGTLWAGTGEANPSGGGLTYFGDGIYKSTDGGGHWQNMGLRDSASFGRIVVDPTDPNTVFAAASGSISRIVSQRGLYRTRDGGQSWQLVLAPPNPTTGAIDIAIDPTNHNRIYAALWDKKRNNGARTYGGIGSGLFRSDDGGDTWKRLENIVGPVASYDGVGSGLHANADLGRIGIAIAPSDPKRVYVVFGTPYGPDKGSYVSNDYGDSFTQMGRAYAASGYQWWFGRLWVDPANENHLFNADVNLRESNDGGATWHTSSGPHSDHHAMAWDPRVANRVYNGDDGGIYRSDANGATGTWKHAVYEPWNQSYHLGVAKDDSTRQVTGLQDNGSVRTWTPTAQPSDLSQWNAYGQGDGHTVAIDPTDSSWYYECFQPSVPRNSCASFHDVAGHMTQTSFGQTGFPANQRYTTDTPFALDPTNPAVVYVGGTVLGRSTNHGQTFTAISPPDPNSLPGPPPANENDLGPFYANEYGAITAIAPAKTAPNTIFVGTDTGRLWKTADLGVTWTQMQGTPTRWVNAIQVDPTNADHVYAAFSGYREGDNAANVYETNDGGTTWTNISANLPNGPVEEINYDQAHHVLYAATDFGLFDRKDGDQYWYSLSGGLPSMPVMDVQLAGDGKSVFVATFGRSVWKLPLSTSVDTGAGGGPGGSVPATLSLTLGAPASFGSFVPGVGQDYSASMSANVISTAGDAMLSVADPSATATGHLVNGSFSLPSALQVKASSPAGTGGAFGPVGGSASPTALLGYTGPVSNDPVAVAFQQHIGSTDALRTGSYSKTLTFTLSTTTP
jgi:photosystem II stability/assembly factor-like uncharacterized protein